MSDMPDEKRAALETMGEDRVRHLLKQQMLVHHLIVPAYEWLDELDAKRKEAGDAVAKGIEQQNDQPEHPRDGQERPSPEASGSGGLPGSGQGSGGASDSA